MRRDRGFHKSGFFTKAALPLLMGLTFLIFAAMGMDHDNPVNLGEVVAGTLFFSLATVLILWAGKLAARARF